MTLEETIKLYDFPFDKTLIANKAIEPRDHSRLLLFDRETGRYQDAHFYQILERLTANDVLVLNESKVFPARLLGKKESGGKVELLLIKQVDTKSWTAISKPALKVGQRLFFPARKILADENLDPEEILNNSLQAIVVEKKENSAEVTVEFTLSADELWQAIDRTGLTPLPPYIHPEENEERLHERYQTVYAKTRGSSAAPTAGLHFTEELLEQLRNKGVKIEKITLHVGLGTFAKLTEKNLQEKKLHQEFYHLDQETVNRLNTAKQSGKRIIAVGTTTLRTLESALASSSSAELKPGSAETQLFIMPPYQFRFVNALITNFHLPKSSLLMLVAAFSSQPNGQSDFHDFATSSLGQAYLHAMDERYRFFSFGDAMFIY